MLQTGFFQIVLNPYNTDSMRQVTELQQKCKKLEEENQFLRQQIDDLKDDDQYNPNLQRKTYRRSTRTINRRFKCPYSDCKKQYGSDLAMNLHIKNKHNGGTKTSRQQLARQIVLAQRSGEPIPEISIEFPPNYLNEIRKSMSSNS